MLGVTGFTFSNLGVNETPKNATEVTHVAEMPIEDCRKAVIIFEQIKALCKMKNVAYDLKYGIIDSMVEKINNSGKRPILPMKIM